MGPIWDAELRVWDAKNFGLVSPRTHRNKFVKKSLQHCIETMQMKLSSQLNLDWPSLKLIPYYEEHQELPYWKEFIRQEVAAYFEATGRFGEEIPDQPPPNPQSINPHPVAFLKYNWVKSHLQKYKYTWGQQYNGDHLRWRGSGLRNSSSCEKKICDTKSLMCLEMTSQIIFPNFSIFFQFHWPQSKTGAPLVYRAQSMMYVRLKFHVLAFE